MRRLFVTARVLLYLERVVARVVVVELLFRYWREHAGCCGVAAASTAATAADAAAAATADTVADEN